MVKQTLDYEIVHYEQRQIQKEKEKLKILKIKCIFKQKSK